MRTILFTFFNQQGIVTLFLICHVWKVIPTTYEAVQSWRDWLEDEFTPNGKDENGANPGMTTNSLLSILSCLKGKSISLGSIF